MAEASDGRVACPHCGKQYRWKPDLAGRKVVCKCGQKMRLPVTSSGRIEPLGPPPAPVDPNEASTYDLEVPDEPPAPASSRPRSPASAGRSGRSFEAASQSPLKCPSCNQPLKAGAVLCVKCGYNLELGQQLQTDIAVAPEEPEQPEAADAEPADEPGVSPVLAAMGGSSAVSRALEDREDEAQPSKVIDLYLPAALIAFGLVTRFAETLFFGDDAAQTFLGALTVMAVDVVIALPLLVLALIVSTKLVGVSFGPLGLAMFKLLAIYLGPAALSDIIAAVGAIILQAGLGGWFLGFIAFILVTWTLLAKLFDLEEMDALFVLIIMFVVNLLATVIYFFFVLGILFA